MNESVNDCWVPYNPRLGNDTGFYIPGEGRETREELVLQFRVEEYETQGLNPKDFPTSKRVDVVLGRNLDEDPDGTVVVLPGWGESSAMFTGSFLDILVRAAIEAGTRNPRFVFPNTGGRGTSEYAEANRGSQTHLKAALSEGNRLAGRLWSEGHLGGPVTVIGHSMGNMLGWELVRGLWKLKEEKPEANINVKQHTALMPAVYKRFAGLHPEFLKAVMELVPAAVERYFTAEGLGLTQEQYNRLMFGGSNREDLENFRRSMPDSARVFLDWVFNFHGQNIPTPPEGSKFRANILGAKEEPLLPQSMAIQQMLDLEGAGVSANYTPLQYFSHGIPFSMSPRQRAELTQSAVQTGMFF